MGIKIGKCRLCLTDNTELLESHIIPSWAYKRLKNKGEKNPNPILIDAEKAITSS